MMQAPMIPQSVTRIYKSERDYHRDAARMTAVGFVVGMHVPGRARGSTVVTWGRMVPVGAPPKVPGQAGQSVGRTLLTLCGAGFLVLLAVAAYRSPSGTYTPYPTATLMPDGAALAANPTLGATATNNAADFATGTAAQATISRATTFVATVTAGVSTRIPATPDTTSVAAATKVRGGYATGTAVVVAAPPCPDSACAAKPGQKVAVIVSDGANLRAAPNGSAMVLTLIPSSAVATVAEQGALAGDGGRGWVHVTYEGQTGFVRADLVSGPDAPITRGPPMNVATVASDRATGLARNAGQSIDDYMREGFRTTSWYPYIMGYRVSSNRIDVMTNLPSQEASKRPANSIRGAVFGYSFDTNPAITFVSVRNITGGALCEGVPGKSGPCY